MTLPQRGLHPTSGDDRRALLSTLKFVACRSLQFTEVVRAVIGQCVSLKPGPQIFHRIQVRRIGWQKRDLDIPVQCVQIVSNEMTVVCAGTVPDHQQRLLQMGLERFEELDQFLLLDTAFVKPEQAIRARHPRDSRDVIPVEVKLNDRRLSLGRPSTHARGAFADTRFVDKDDQSTVALGFFLSAGQVLRF